jgi:phospholipid-translocating ATPase
MLIGYRFLEMHNKTYMAAIGWVVSVGGWWVWTLALDGGVPPQAKKNILPYPIKNNFVHGYGADLEWWLAIFVTLASFIVFEFAVSSVRKTWWPTDTDTFQVLQKDPIIKKRFEETARNEEEGKVSVETAMETRTSAEAQREGEIQELLDRPRVMGDTENAEGATSDVQVSGSPSGSLVRRKFSVDGNGRSEEDFEMTSPRYGTVPKTRHSVDIAEALGRR